NERYALKARDEARAAGNASARQTAGLLFDRGLARVEHGDVAGGVHWMAQALKILPDEPEDRPFAPGIRTNLASWGRHLHRPEAPLDADDVTCVVWSPDGQTIAIGHLDGTVRFWDAGTGRPARAALPAARAKDPPVITCLAFSPDGRKLAVGLGAPRGGNAADGVALLWDLSGEQPS